MTAESLFNDPSGFAWFIVAAYIVGALCAFIASRSAKQNEARFWVGVAVLLVLLGLNKELDLQSLLTQSGRDLARAFGVYEQRRLVQAAFLLVLAFAGLAAIFGLVRTLRRSSKPAKAAAVGIAILLAFILLRAASFHHIDNWVTVDVGGLRGGWWLELAGIAVIGLSAIASRR